MTNLVWVWDVQDLDFNWAPYNPGDGYWDVAAMDMYGDGYTTRKYESETVHPTKAYFVSCIARILSLKNSWSRNP